jgi:hypothetical protein
LATVHSEKCSSLKSNQNQEITRLDELLRTG